MPFSEWLDDSLMPNNVQRQNMPEEMNHVLAYWPVYTADLFSTARMSGWDGLDTILWLWRKETESVCDFQGQKRGKEK